MLKGIPDILCPELLKVLMEMGHGDEIVLADANFPSESISDNVVRLDGHDIPKILNAILKFYPLDQYVEKPVGLMEVVPGDDYNPEIWEEYKKIIDSFERGGSEKIEYIEKFEFYKRAKKAYAIVATGEKALYANMILKKGVINES